MDFGKFKYESALKARESRKNQAQTVIKEIKIRPKIDPHDYGTKRGHVERFLRQGDKVKVTIMFRGREQSRPELGYKLLQRLAGDVEELGFVESQPKQDGRNMIMVIGPHRKKAETKAVRGQDRASARAAAPAAGASRDSGSGASDPRRATPGSAAPAARAAAPAPRPTAPKPAAPDRAAPDRAAPDGAAPDSAAPAASAAAAAPRPAAPRPAAPKPAAPRAMAPRPAPPKPAAPGPRARPASRGAAGGLAGG